jgi:hypothetical protein
MSKKRFGRGAQRSGQSLERCSVLADLIRVVYSGDDSTGSLISTA